MNKDLQVALNSALRIALNNALRIALNNSKRRPASKAINSTSSPSASNDMLLDCKVPRPLTQEARLEDILCVIAIIRRSVCLEWHAKRIPQKNSAKEFRTAPKKSSSKCPSKFGIRSPSYVLHNILHNVLLNNLRPP